MSLERCTGLPIRTGLHSCSLYLILRVSWKSVARHAAFRSSDLRSLRMLGRISVRKHSPSKTVSDSARDKFCDHHSARRSEIRGRLCRPTPRHEARAAATSTASSKARLCADESNPAGINSISISLPATSVSLATSARDIECRASRFPGALGVPTKRGPGMQAHAGLQLGAQIMPAPLGSRLAA